MKKDKNPEEEMSNKKRLQNLVWDGLSNSLDNKTAENKSANFSKKEKKSKKNENTTSKPDDNSRPE